MPAWVLNRAERILQKNPDMDKGEAFAIATQQAHALGKTPQGYGTSEGRRTAKKKYRSPAAYQKTAEAQMWLAFFDELEKTAGPFTPLRGVARSIGQFGSRAGQSIGQGFQNISSKLRSQMAPALGRVSSRGTSGFLPGTGTAKATPAISSSVPSFGSVATPTMSTTGAAAAPGM